MCERSCKRHNPKRTPLLSVDAEREVGIHLLQVASLLDLKIKEWK
jgi:hypothetical protein